MINIGSSVMSSDIIFLKIFDFDATPDQKLLLFFVYTRESDLAKSLP